MADNNADNSQAEQGGQQSQADTTNTTNTQSQADSSNTNSQKQEPKLTKEEFERLSKNLHEANSEAKNLRTRLKALEVEKETTEANKLKEAGEFKTLYEQEQARVKEFEPVVEENSFLREYAMKQLEATIKDWPDEVKTFDPGKKAPLQDRLNWLEKSKPLVAKLQGQQLQQRQAGSFRSPTPVNNQNGPKTADDYYKEMKLGRPF